MPSLPPMLTMHEASLACATLVQRLAAGSGPVEIDAAALERFDSSALSVLLECRRQAVAAGRAFAVTGAPPRLAELARLYGIEELLAPAPAEA